MSSSPVRVRFAPSPTGNLHIGGARTALFNWLLARKTGGQFIIRVEDTDAERSKRHFEDAILGELRWLGLDWDEGPDVGGPHAPYRQTERMERYNALYTQMLKDGTAYRCTCSEERLNALRADQEAQKAARRGYDGHCRDAGLGADCGPHVVRLRVPEGETHVDDLIKGDVCFANADIEDFVIVRPDGMPMYNFVVVCDDVDMGITHVLRGDEHLINTPKQLLIYAALATAAAGSGAQLLGSVVPPRFGHMPLILALDGSKMSKRNGETSVGAYRELGIHPEAMMNYLARLGWSHGDQEIFSVDDLRTLFTAEGIGKSPSKWDMEKLTWVNSHWMRALPAETVALRARAFFADRGWSAHPREVALVACLRERTRTLVELADAARIFFTDDYVRDEAVMAATLPAARDVLTGVVTVLSATEDWSEKSLEAAVHGWCETNGIKLGKVAQPVRVALCGQKVGPGLYQTLHVLGREVALQRLQAAIA
jgi:glutamyl-tRNA synthetase